MKSNTRIIFRLLLLCLFIFNCFLYPKYIQAQNQTIGLYPTMQGGFETGVPAALASATVVTGTQLANWSYATAAQNTGTAINTALFRSGAKCFNWTNSSTSATLISPTTASASVVSASSYVVQFYWYKNNTGNARALNVQISPDATAALGTAVSSGTLGVNGVTSTGWTKSTVIVNSGTSVANPRYGFAQLKPNGGSFANFLIDDFCVYPGSTADVTAPVAATGASASSTSNTTVDLTWNGILKVGDGGGYVIVRSTSPTPVTLNDNGIYGVGLNTATGGGTVIGVVDGVDGLNTFSDIGLTSGVTYYYSIFATDKAFNYAPAATCSVVASTSPFIITSVSTLSGFTQYVFPSPSQSYTITGLRLTGATVDLSVSANFQISLNNTTWSSNVSLPVSNGGLTGQPITIYVRLNAAASGAYSGTITHNSSGANQVVVTLNGNTDNNTRITTSVNSLTGFSQVGVTPSASQSYTVSGFAITDPSVLLTASTGFQLSLNNTTWSSTLSLPSSGGIITGQPVLIYVRLNDAIQGPHTGTITHTCTGATTVVVNLNGNTITTPSISVSPSTLAFGNITLGQNSVVQSFNLSGFLLSPSAGTLTITAPAGFSISTSAGSGFSNTININYTAGTIAATPIYVIFSPLNDVAYTANIIVSGGTASNAQVTCTGAGTLYQIGDFGSVASGTWSTVNIWRQWDGSGFNTIATAMPGSTNNVWILSGTTVTTDAAERTCKNLFVSGNLKTNSLAKADQYIGVYGSILKMFAGGFIGDVLNPTGDLANGISLRCYNTQLTVTGSEGSVYFSRMTTKLLNCNLVIDRDINLVYHGTSNQGGHTVACFPEVANSSITINAGKTLLFHPWSSLSTTENTGTLHPARSFTVNVYGTIQMLNSPAPNSANEANNLYNYRNSFIYGGVSGAANQFVLNVWNGGVVTTAEIYPNGSDGISTTPICWQYNSGVGIGNLSVINVTSGGTLNVYKVADFRKPTQTITGGGTFRLQNNARIRIGSPNGISYAAMTGPIQTATRIYDPTTAFWYEGLSAQLSGDGMINGISGLLVNNNFHLTLNASAIATDSINLVNGKLILGDNNVTTNVIRLNTTSKYIVTNGGGYLKLTNLTAAERTFPIGPDTISYNPAYLVNTGTVDHYSVKVRPYTLPTGVPWPAGVPRLFRSIQTGFWNSPSTWETETFRIGAAVNRSWSVLENVAGGSNVSIRLQWNPADELPGFNRNSSAVFRFNGSLIDFPVAPIPYTAAAGAVPYTQTGSGLNAVAQQFGVASDTSSSPSFGPSVNEFPNSALSNVVVNTPHTVTGNTGSSITCGNFQLDGILSLSGTAGDNMNVHGNWTKNGAANFVHNSRTVNLVGANNTTLTAVNGMSFFSLQLQKNSLAGNVTLLDSISIVKELNINTGTLDLAGKNITLLSDAVNTASIGPVSNTGSILYSGSGRFVVERFVNTGVGAGSHPKSWQLLCAPTIGQTIKQAWMENGSSNSNPSPGYGTQIVGIGGVPAGFDMIAPSTSIKIYSPADSNYLNVANTSLPVNNSQGYVLFVRGDRSVTTFNAPATPTKLRSKGTIQTGNVNGPVIPAGKFQSVANPYPSAINYTNVTKSGLIPFIYVFDPILSGYYGLGAYQTIELSNGNATPGGTSVYSTNGDYRTIQSGQAFFVKANSAANGGISFKESDKVSGSRLATRTGTDVSLASKSSIQSKLYVLLNGTAQLTDGNKINFGDGNADKVDEQDAVKLRNGADNFGIQESGALLAIENRSALKKLDSVRYFFQPYQTGIYQIGLEITSDLISSNIYLLDTYLDKKILLNDENHYNYSFEVNNASASKSTDRFILIIQSGLKTSSQISIAALDTENECTSLIIQPNPVENDQLKFRLSERVSGKISFSIINAVGQPILKGVIPPLDEFNSGMIALPKKVISGNYLLKLNGISQFSVSARFTIL